jgi:hypothetical protein
VERLRTRLPTPAPSLLAADEPNAALIPVPVRTSVQLETALCAPHLALRRWPDAGRLLFQPRIRRIGLACRRNWGAILALRSLYSGASKDC